MDPKYSRWMSTDPALGEYVSGSESGGGIGNTFNFHLYNYSNNNPIRYMDPDGNSVGSVVKSFAQGAWDAAKNDAQGAWNAVTHPIQTAKNTYNAVVAEASSFVADPMGYAQQKVDDAVQGVVNFIESSPEEKAYVLGGMAEGIAVDAVGSAVAVGVATKVAKSSKAVAAISDGCPGACFVAGTMVSTANGLKLIEQINVGDYVYSYEEATGYVVLQKVVNTFVRETNETVTVRTSEDEIVTTSEHPFWVENEGWVTAGKLSCGDRLFSENGRTLCVESVAVLELEESVKVYNFEVENTHTYFVGNGCVLVHNTCSGKTGGISKRNSSEKQALIEMAKQDKKAGGMTEADFKAYVDLNQTLSDPIPSDKIHGVEQHLDRPSPTSQQKHCHVGPVGHIPITD